MVSVLGVCVQGVSVGGGHMSLGLVSWGLHVQGGYVLEPSSHGPAYTVSIVRPADVAMEAVLRRLNISKFSNIMG